MADVVKFPEPVPTPEEVAKDCDRLCREALTLTDSKAQVRLLAAWTFDMIRRGGLKVIK